MWYALPGNPYMVNISPLMLLPGGYKIERSVKPSKNAVKENWQVTYDYQFVIQSIESTVIEPLKGLDDKTIIELFTEALEFHRWLNNQEIPAYVESKNKRFYLWEKFQSYKDSLKDLQQ